MNTILIKIILLVNVPFFPQQLQSYLLEKGLRTEIVVSRLDDINLVGNQNLLFSYLSTAFRYNPKYYNYVITERFLGADNNLYHLGLARPIERLAMGTYGENPELGNKRLYKTYLIAAHEIGHLLGLPHDGSGDCITIMDADAGNCANWIDLGFSTEQLRIMNKRRSTRRRDLQTCFVRWNNMTTEKSEKEELEKIADRLNCFIDSYGNMHSPAYIDFCVLKGATLQKLQSIVCPDQPQQPTAASLKASVDYNRAEVNRLNNVIANRDYEIEQLKAGQQPTAREESEIFLTEFIEFIGAYYLQDENIPYGRIEELAETFIKEQEKK